MTVTHHEPSIRAASKFREKPIEEIECVLFDDEPAARHWIELRHGGVLDGIGVKPWSPDNIDNFRARHGGKRRSHAGQVFDLLKTVGAEVDSSGITSVINRVLSSPDVRKALGLDLVNGELVTRHSLAETRKALEHLVDEFSSKRVKTGDVYDADQRRDYAGSIPKSARPTKASRLPGPVPLTDLPTYKEPRGTGRTKPPAATPPAPTPRPRTRPTEQTSIVPTDCTIAPTNPRLNDIYNELLALPVAIYPNAVAVMFRVFVELSCDHYIDKWKLIPDAQRRSKRLADKIRLVAADLHGKAKINQSLHTALNTVADSKSSYLMANTPTMNQYVHNMHAHPKASELQQAFREMQPFLEQL